MRRLSDFADDQLALEGLKSRIEEVEGKELELIKCRFAASRFEGRCPDYATLQFRYPGEEQLRVLFTGSGVIIDQLRSYTTLFHTSHPQLCGALRKSPLWIQKSAHLYGGNKAKSIKTMSSSAAARGERPRNGGFGGHFRAVQGFEYIGGAQ